MKIYAKCPENLDTTKTPYLTPGKMYEVVRDDEYTLWIIDDDGDESDPRHCLWVDCLHLYGLNWTRIEIPDDVESPQMLIEVKTRADVLAEDAENMVGALRESEENMHAVIEAIDAYNAENEAFIGGGPIFRLAKSVGTIRAILARIDGVKG